LLSHFSAGGERQRLGMEKRKEKSVLEKGTMVRKGKQREKGKGMNGVLYFLAPSSRKHFIRQCLAAVLLLFLWKVLEKNRLVTK